MANKYSKDWIKNEVKCILAESFIKEDEDAIEPEDKVSPREKQKHNRRVSVMSRMVRRDIASGKRSPNAAGNAMAKAFNLKKPEFANVRVGDNGELTKTRSSGRYGEAGRTRHTTPGPLGNSRANSLDAPKKNPEEIKPSSSFVGKAPSEDKVRDLDRVAYRSDPMVAKRRMMAHKIAKMRGSPGIVAKANINPEVKKAIIRKRMEQKPLSKPELP